MPAPSGAGFCELRQAGTIDTFGASSLSTLM